MTYILYVANIGHSSVHSVPFVLNRQPPRRLVASHQNGCNIHTVYESTAWSPPLLSAPSHWHNRFLVDDYEQLLVLGLGFETQRSIKATRVSLQDRDCHRGLSPTRVQCPLRLHYHDSATPERE